jgi:hypothetical protein
MLGGVTIESEAQARTFTAAMRASPASWTPRDLEPAPLRIGETLDLEPCVGPAYEAQFGRECPRVELWPENEPAAELVFAVLPEHTRALLPAYVDAITAPLDADAGRAVVVRAMRALHGEAVANWLRAQYQREEDA